MRWKGLFEGGGSQIVYTVLALACFISAPQTAALTTGLGIVCLGGVFVWLGWFDD